MGSTKTLVRYVHPELGKDIPTGIAGYYTPEKEVRLPFKGREVLYVRGTAVLEASCCGTGKWPYATVPGYLVNYKSLEQDGRAVSEVEPIVEAEEREQLRTILEEKELADLIQFPSS